MPKTFTKDGQTRLAYSPTQAVNLVAEGWREAVAAIPEANPVPVVNAVPEVLADVVAPESE